MSQDIENFLDSESTRSGDSTEICEFVGELIKEKDDPEKAMKILRRKYQLSLSKREIHGIYKKHFSTTKITPKMRKWMIKKQMRSNSGVLVVTIVLAPHKFSCKYDCSYCPQETDLEGKHTQPRSYLSNEPAMLRALESNFDVKGQFNSRINSYKLTGNIDDSHHSSKIEVIFSGGTWESYPLEYREQVIRELYWAANTFENKREPLTLEEEISNNETSEYRIIGFTLETRPDNISHTTIKDYRRWGITRIQIGVQHYDDAILKAANRKCYTKDTIRAIMLLKQAGFKVVVHLMPDLPGSSPEQDKWMFDEAINNPDLQFDDIKIYPTAVVQSFDEKHIVSSKILEMYKAKLFVPYSEKNLQDLIDVCIYYKTRINPWVRIQRLVRDIPGNDIAAGYNKISNLRQIIHNQMEKKSLKCYCIRCMEIGDKEHDNLKPMVAVRKYTASGGTEYHISLEAHSMNNTQILMYYLMVIYMYLITLCTGLLCYWPGDLESYIGLYGFLRLRIDKNPGGGYIPELRGCALVREVHVYGTSMGVGSESDGSQHKGYGKLLMATAETIAKAAGWNKVAVIAGIGTREYYKDKCGYRLEGTYMVKDI